MRDISSGHPIKMNNTMNLNTPKSCLYVVATPIGNLDDFTPRAQAILKSVDLICSEDTRHSGQLLSLFGITTPQISLHQHNELERIAVLLEKLKAGQTLALISDAGTPLISDPGFPLVRALRNEGIDVIPIPGACALISALSVAGLPTDRFVFEGFLSAKSSARKQQLTALKSENRTLIFYESSHRIIAMLADLKAIFGDTRLGFVGREITKKFESYLSLDLGALHEYYQAHPEQIRGEFVVIVAGAQKDPDHIEAAGNIDLDTVLRPLLSALPLKKAVQIACEITQLKKNFVYERALSLSSNPNDLLVD